MSRTKGLWSGWRRRALGLAVLLAAGSGLGLLAVTLPGDAGTEPDRPARIGRAVEASLHRSEPPLGVDGFLELERRLGEERRARVQGMLDRLWPERAFVTVGVELDPRWVSSDERIQPEDPAVVEEERDLAANGSRRRSLEPFSGERQVTLIAPEIRRVSAALVLDAAIARDPRQQQRIVDAVKKALGPVRGQDADVEVLVESFAPKPQPATTRRVLPAEQPEQDFTVLTASIALSSLGVAWFWLRRSRRRRLAAPVPGAITPEVAPAEAARARRTAIEDAIRDDPVFASKLVESWMAEGRA